VDSNHFRACGNVAKTLAAELNLLMHKHLRHVEYLASHEKLAKRL